MLITALINDTPLHYAINSNAIKSARILIKKGANINANDKVCYC